MKNIFKQNNLIIIFCFFCIFLANTAFAYTRTPNDLIYSDSYIYDFTDEVGGTECDGANWGYAVNIRTSLFDTYAYSDIISSTTGYTANVEIGSSFYNSDLSTYYDIYNHTLMLGLVPFCSTDPIGYPPADSIYNQSYIDDDVHIFLAEEDCEVSTSTCDIATSTDNIMDITAVSSDGTTIIYRAPFLLLLTFIFVIILSIIFFIIFYQYGSSRRRINK